MSAYRVNVGHSTHKLTPELTICGLRAQLAGEFGSQWYACVMFADGTATMRGPTASYPKPPEPVFNALLNTSAMLNRDLHHNGSWVTVWADDRLNFLWRDWDGDMVLIVQVDEPWPRVAQWTTYELCERAERAINTFTEQLRAVELKPEHTIKLAQGEKPRLLH